MQEIREERLMKRYLGQRQYDRFLLDFKFLFEIVKNSFGELDLRLRDGYFNIYYKGNSLAKIEFNENGRYRITIHRKFAEDTISATSFPSRFAGKDYRAYSVEAKNLGSFFRSKHMKGLCSKIAKVNYGEEITFEQMLITDNLEREELFIIDRQIGEPGFGKRLDLLALIQHHENKYHLAVIEVKLGKNAELKNQVGAQLNKYLKHIEENFDEWKSSYEMCYRQLKNDSIGIYHRPSYDNVEIVQPVKGIVIVGGYSKMAEKSISELGVHYPKICIQPFRNLINHKAC
jgi:hypothetical protein